MLARIAAGCLILATFAAIDLYRNGSKARRWREYAFLLFCVVLALAYGVVNDQATVGISWEYFYYGKELYPVLGDQTPPDEWRLRWEAAKVGLKATWSAGLVLGVILLFANNPTRKLQPLPFRQLLRFLPAMLSITIACAILLGIIGYLGGLQFVTSEFDPLVEQNLWRPRRFMAVFGIHLGGYLGGLLGTITAAVLIRRRRNQLDVMHSDHASIQ